MREVKRSGERRTNPRLSGARLGTLTFRISAFLWRRLYALGAFLEHSGERALKLSIFRAGEFLRHPLPRRTKIHPLLAVRTSGVALAALFHRISPALEERGILTALRKRDRALRRFASSLARQPERAMPAGIALLLGIAVVASLLPGPPADARAFAVSDSAEALDTDPNFNSAGLLWGSGLDLDRFAPAAQAEMEVSSDPAPDIEGSGGYGWRAVEPAQEALAASDATAESEGAIFLADGTMRPPAAIDISIADGRAHVSIHVVQRGDTLKSIAKRYGITVMQIAWSNGLISTATPPAGRRLRIPDVAGVVHVVSEHETLRSISSRYRVKVDDVVAYNGLRSRDVILGMVLVLPGGRGNALPTTQFYSSYAYGGAPPAAYSGISLKYPVPGGHYVRGFTSKHPAMDIGARYGATVVSAAAGRVVWVGYKNNCGGNQVYIAHGNNLYTGYFHLSAFLVKVGDNVSRGQIVGKVGTSGCTTGPHLHFMVSRGWPHRSGSVFYNPAQFLP
jgi:murein DD-endopeptidase MepM/ murein hydrolase activator NlpD